MAQDACELLDADHQRVEALFTEYLSAGSDRTLKTDLAQIICMELTVHTQLEEEIFYPAFRQASGDEALVQEATREHDEARDLIARIESTEDADALVLQLQKTVAHHVQDERTTMFPKARSTTGLDLDQLATQLRSRKTELVSRYQEA